MKIIRLYRNIRPNLSRRGSLRFAFWTWWYTSVNTQWMKRRAAENEEKK